MEVVIIEQMTPYYAKDRKAVGNTTFKLVTPPR